MKTVEEIYDEMLAVFRRETGAEASAVSDLSVKLYAVAAQVYVLSTDGPGGVAGPPCGSAGAGAEKGGEGGGSHPLFGGYACRG